ncbi:hypothetical protein BGZ90_000061, partial [Linnemannia elongata]
IERKHEGPRIPTPGHLPSSDPCSWDWICHPTDGLAALQGRTGLFAYCQSLAYYYRHSCCRCV